MSDGDPLYDLIALLLPEDPYAPFRHILRLDCPQCGEEYSGSYGGIALRTEHICGWCGLDLYDELDARSKEHLKEALDRWLQLLGIDQPRGLIQ